MKPTMKTRITNYDDLLKERRRIKQEIKLDRLVITDSVTALKAKFDPLLYIMPYLSIFKKHHSSNSLAKTAASVGIDLLVGQKLLSKAGWLTKLIVPMILKTVSTVAIGRK